MTVYNKIGKGYATHRKADPRIVESIYRLLDLPENSLVLDVGAGSGNYSNALAEKGFKIFAIEPSYIMASQAVHHPKVKWSLGTAEQIPISDRSIDGIIIVCAVHHFKSLGQAALEFDRISKSGSIVVFTFDPRQSDVFWLAEYFPAIWKEAFLSFFHINSVADSIANSRWTYEITPFPLPDDLTDKFMASGWKFPEMYLEESMRNSMSAFALADPIIVENGIAKLKKDLDSGFWDKTYGTIRDKKEIDLGYRFIKFKRKLS
jgi:ubiquinone/menaquinone biosynthesis C-methylase UbiE